MIGGLVVGIHKGNNQTVLEVKDDYDECKVKVEGLPEVNLLDFVWWQSNIVLWTNEMHQDKHLVKIGESYS